MPAEIDDAKRGVRVRRGMKSAAKAAADFVNATDYKNRSTFVAQYNDAVEGISEKLEEMYAKTGTVPTDEDLDKVLPKVFAVFLPILEGKYGDKKAVTVGTIAESRNATLIREIDQLLDEEGKLLEVVPEKARKKHPGLVAINDDLKKLSLERRAAALIAKYCASDPLTISEYAAFKSPPGRITTDTGAFDRAGTKARWDAMKTQTPVPVAMQSAAEASKYYDKAWTAFLELDDLLRGVTKPMDAARVAVLERAVDENSVEGARWDPEIHKKKSKYSNKTWVEKQLDAQEQTLAKYRTNPGAVIYSETVPAGPLTRFVTVAERFPTPPAVAPPPRNMRERLFQTFKGTPVMADPPKRAQLVEVAKAFEKVIKDHAEKGHLAEEAASGKWFFGAGVALDDEKLRNELRDAIADPVFDTADKTDIMAVMRECMDSSSVRNLSTSVSRAASSIGVGTSATRGMAP